MQSADIQAALRDLFRVGLVVSTAPGNGTVRVQFPDVDNVVSYDMQVLFQKTHQDKAYWMPDIGELVPCIFLGNGPEAGFVLGAVYNGADGVPVASQDKCHIKFKDGTTLEYDRAEHVLKADVQGRAEITTTEDISAEAGTTIDATAADTINATAGTSASITAPTIFVNGILMVQGQGGKGTTAKLTGNFEIVGNLAVTEAVDVGGSVGIGGSLSTAGNSHAGSRTGGAP